MACYRIYRGTERLELHHITIGIELVSAAVTIEEESASGIGPTKLLGFVRRVDGVVRLHPHAPCAPSDVQSVVETALLGRVPPPPNCPVLDPPSTATLSGTPSPLLR